ncbi:MAG TPA: DUF4166 domain-containing protein [Chthoniobacteraceae bacterium]|nr:DUF4166 domain-containing protein [Chthoniobacteraceae bacterium]
MQPLRTEPTAQLLPGEICAQLAEPLQRAHCTDVEFRGAFRVEHGRGWLARLLARLSRLPSAGANIETHLLITADGPHTHWRRSFAGRTFCTTQWFDGSSCVVERWGPIQLRFRLIVREDELRYEQAGAALHVGPLRMPLPRWLAPRVEASEWPLECKRVGVRVSVTLPLVGRLLAYEGEVQT